MLWINVKPPMAYQVQVGFLNDVVMPDPNMDSDSSSEDEDEDENENGEEDGSAGEE